MVCEFSNKDCSFFKKTPEGASEKDKLTIMWLELKPWHCTNMAQKTCCTRSVVFVSLITRGECINKTWPNDNLFQLDLDGNESLMQMRHCSISHYSHYDGVNKKPWRLLCALGKANLVYSESYKGNPPARECFTKPSLEMWLNVFRNEGWGSFNSTFMSNKERRKDRPWIHPSDSEWWDQAKKHRHTV